MEALKIYERSIDHLEWSWDFVASTKIDRGWLHVVKDSYDDYKIIWTLRERQQTCEIVTQSETKIAEILKAFKRGEKLTYVFLGRRAIKKLRPDLAGPRDSQRQKCYDWEKKYLRKFYVKIPPSEMTDFIRKITKESGLTGVTIKYRTGGSSSTATGSNLLKFLPCHMNKIVACHEVAHLIMHKKHGNKIAGHGPEWVREYVRLLTTYCNLEEKNLYQTLAYEGIKF